MKRFGQFVLGLLFLVGVSQMWIMTTHQTQTRSRIIVLISTPRSVTTAFERVFMERGDFSVVHEPWSTLEWYRRYGRDGFEGEVPDLALRAKTFDDVIVLVNREAQNKPVFVKDFAYSTSKGLRGNEDWVADPNVEITFLVRHPAKVVRSYYKRMPEFPRDTVDYQELWELAQWVEHVKGKAPIFVDADRLLRDPENVMRSYCEQLGIPFIPQAVSWAPSMKEEWEDSLQDISEHARGELHSLVGRQLPYYERMRRRSI